MDRRTFLQAGAALALGATGISAHAMRGAKVVVIGGGYGGATAAKYIRLLSNQKIDVTLVEPDKEFISCPLSNLVLGGSRTLADLSHPYSTLTKNHGINVARDYAVSIDPVARVVKLAGGNTLKYDPRPQIQSFPEGVFLCKFVGNSLMGSPRSKIGPVDFNFLVLLDLARLDMRVGGDHAVEGDVHLGANQIGHGL